MLKTKIAEDFARQSVEAFNREGILNCESTNKMKQSINRLPFTDKEGKQIFEDDIIYNQKHYYRIYFNKDQNQCEAFAPTYGYLHNIKQEDLKEFQRIGNYEEFKGLMR